VAEHVSKCYSKTNPWTWQHKQYIVILRCIFEESVVIRLCS